MKDQQLGATLIEALIALSLMSGLALASIFSALTCLQLTRKAIEPIDEVELIQGAGQGLESSPYWS